MHSKMSGSTCCFIKRTATSNLKSGKRLCDETLETVTKYFDNIYNAQVANGLLMKKREKQIELRYHTKVDKLVV